MLLKILTQTLSSPGDRVFAKCSTGRHLAKVFLTKNRNTKVEDLNVGIICV